MSEPVSEEEAFYLEFDWFLGHVKSLALDGKACCEDQTNYNVAHELWYFIRVDRLSTKLGKMITDEQLSAIDALCKAVADVPEGARVWTEVAEQSEKNMTNEAWTLPRKLAGIVLRLIEPVMW